MSDINYDNFSSTFSKSRESMHWPEIDYFLNNYFPYINEKKILDIGCGNGRLLGHLLKNNNISDFDYFGIDSSLGMINEAKKKYNINDFFHFDMKLINEFNHKNFETVFFIASFHHLKTIQERRDVLNKLKQIIKKGSYIFFTSWALDSEFNKEKYISSMIQDSINEFQSKDYTIKIGNFNRFYHCFSLEELNYLFTTTGYEILENRYFEGQKNIISLLRF